MTFEDILLANLKQVARSKEFSFGKKNAEKDLNFTTFGRKIKTFWRQRSFHLLTK